MKKRTTLLSILICIAFFSCERDYNNPYDRECPPEIWTPQNLVADTSVNGLLLTWEQKEMHFDGYLIEYSIDNITWDQIKLDDCSIKSFNDFRAQIGTNYYRVAAFADQNQSQYSTVKVNIKCLCEENRFEYFTDPRDGHIYKTITIGTQTWMAENLAYLPYVNTGSQTSTTSPRYHVYDYNGQIVSSAKATSNYKNYGVLYNKTASLTACPVGWHIPSQSEWKTLENYLIANGLNYDESNTENKIAKSMASTTDWTISLIYGTVGNDQKNNNRSCFSALPGGWMVYGFDGLGACGLFWWSNSVGLSGEMGRDLHNDYPNLHYFYSYDNTFTAIAVSIRCIKN